MPLFLSATDLSGNPVSVGLSQPLPLASVRDAPQVTIPLSDSRTGQIEVSIYDTIAAALIQPAITQVKVIYQNPKGTRTLLLWGFVLQPTADFDGGTVTATLIDATVKLKRRYLRYGHVSIDLSQGVEVVDSSVNAFSGGSFNGVTSIYGIPLDGVGLRVILYDAGYGTADQGVSTVPGTGIHKGVENSTAQPALVSGSPPVGVGIVNGSVTEGFTATTTDGSTSLTGVSFSGCAWEGVGSPTISDIKEGARLDGPGIQPYAAVASASGTTIVMTLPATASATTDNVFVAEDAIYCQLSRGDACYDDITDMVQAAGGFEVDYVPFDDHFNPLSLTWSAGYTCALHTADRIGTDRSQGNTDGNEPVVFVHGLGGFHLTYAPDADQLVTYDVEVGPGGPADPGDLFNKAIYQGPTLTTYGIWENWDQATSAGTGDNPISNAVLENRAEAVVAAFGSPPQFITATIDSDALGTYVYPDDFGIGDTVTVYATKGAVTLGPLAVRLTQIGVSQVDSDGNCQISLTMVPHLTASPGLQGLEE